MPHGDELYALAYSRRGQKYLNMNIPKDDPNWQGPWDCAEFASWLVYQVSGRLYGCFDNRGDPATAEAYTGRWQVDSGATGRRIDWREAAGIRGAMLLRFPPARGKMGHIAVSDGAGGTMEAMGVAYGVRTGQVSGRTWHCGVLIPWIDYGPSANRLDLHEPDIVYGEGMPNLDPRIVSRIQDALVQNGLDPGPIDGEFGAVTAAAVATFQTMRGLVVDGLVGTQTATALGVQLR